MSKTSSVQGKVVQCMWHEGAKFDECLLLYDRLARKLTRTAHQPKGVVYPDGRIVSE